MFGWATISTDLHAGAVFVPAPILVAAPFLVVFVEVLPQVYLVLPIVGSVGFCGGWALK